MDSRCGTRRRTRFAHGKEGVTGARKTYLCIDLKSFYASVECIARGLDPFKANLVVADPDRSRTTICLAVSPALKRLGVPGRCRLFEVPDGIDFITAKPRMRRYMEVSSEIYSIYLRYVSPDDVHVYSIDECFIDATPYLALYGTDARAFARTLMDAVFAETGICATAGIGENLFLAKVALDITAKHADDGIGELTEASFRETIWDHTPITDIWNIGPGIAARLARYGAHTLRDVAHMREDTLYREFGVNAEYLIDHAWGQEPCTITEIHAYEPQGHSLVNSQVLPCDYSFDEARMVLREMTDASVLDLVANGYAARRVSLSVGYARDRRGAGASAAEAARVFDGGHGKRVIASPEARAQGRSGGERTLPAPTNSFAEIFARIDALYGETVDRTRVIRRIAVGFSDLVPEESVQRSLFDGADETRGHDRERERHLADAVIAVKGKFGKNALLKGTSYFDKATARERNEQIGGHHA